MAENACQSRTARLGQRNRPFLITLCYKDGVKRCAITRMPGKAVFKPVERFLPLCGVTVIHGTLTMIVITGRLTLFLNG